MVLLKYIIKKANWEPPKVLECNVCASLQDLVAHSLTCCTVIHHCSVVGGFLLYLTPHLSAVVVPIVADHLIPLR